MHIQWNKNPAESIYADEVTLTNGGSNTLRTRLNFTKDKEKSPSLVVSFEDIGEYNIRVKPILATFKYG